MTTPTTASAPMTAGAGPSPAPAQTARAPRDRVVQPPSTGPIRINAWRGLPWLAMLAITLCWDRAVYLHVALTGEAKAAMEHAGWYVALRALGTLYPWAALAAVFLLIDLGGGGGTGAARQPGNQPWARARNPLRRPVFLLLCPVLAGAAAEILKPLIGRYKPEETNGYFALASLRDRISEWSDLGMASSHTSVAFGGAFALCWLLPRGAPLFVSGAVGCAMTRLLAGGHFLSDVYVGVVIGYLVTLLVHRVDLKNNSGAPI